MIFSSLLFLFRFLPAVLAIYYIVPRSLRNFVLLLFSLLFYAWGEPVYIILMLTSIMTTYLGGIMIDFFRRSHNRAGAKIALALTTVISLGLLGFFKYADFAISTVNSVARTNFTLLKLGLPIGISFYTFQSLSYAIDVYRGTARVQKNPISYGAYVAMFPQLIAGPIVQYKTIDLQLRKRRESASEFALGIHRFMVGLGKKVLLANNAGAMWESIRCLQVSSLPVVTAWMGIIAYSLQLYFDFSAYSDMAIGLGHMFGFSFLENFNYPYISKSITEFWRRWHISLSSWFRDYVYIPLGGNRVSGSRHILNLMIVWLLTGFWHGASWNFVVWGLYYGILLILEKYVIGRFIAKLPGILQHIYCLFFVIIGWNLFVFDDFAKGISYLKGLFGVYGQGMLNTQTIYLLRNNAVLLLFLVLGSTRIPKKLASSICHNLEEHDIALILLKGMFYVIIFLLSVAWLVDASYNPFLYFRF